MPEYSRSSFSIRHFRQAVILWAALSVFLTLSPAAFAKTYIITDGDRTVTYTGHAPDPAGHTDPDGSDPLTAADGEPVSIRRIPEVCLSYRGEVSSVTSSGETVGELLTRLSLEITPQDTLSHPLDAPVTDGMELQVDLTVCRQEVYTATVPHRISYCTDTALPAGTEEILIDGQDGELMVTAEVTYVNGTETGRTVLREVQTIAPIEEVIARGTGKAAEPETRDMPIIEDGYIVMPSGEILTYYKTDNVTATGYTHTDAGCDLITSTGTTVRYGTAAVDPRFIPYGTRMLIVSHDGERYYGIATAEDCGGAIKRDKMDLYFPTYQECIEFGRRRCTIYFLG